MLIIKTHDLLTKNNASPANSATETSTLMKSTSETVSEKPNQELLNDIFEGFDMLLAEAVSDDNYLSKYERIKGQLRQLFNHLGKQNHALQQQIDALKSRVSYLEPFENNDTIIKMGNVAMQLRNKFVRFIKPNLSYRAARDEYVASLQTEDRYQPLENFIKAQDADLSISNLARQIKTLLNARVSKPHKETPISTSEIDTVLHDYAAQSDEYSKQAANTVERFLKLLSEHHNEPLIVRLA